LGRYRAIVHEEAGTTRDVIEEDIEVRGRRWKLVDTAGFRESSEIREKEGIELGERFLSAAAFWILVVDGSQGISLDEENLIEKYGNKPHLVVWNKKDLEQWLAPKGKWYGKSVQPLSAKTAEGINGLWEKLEVELSKKESQGPLPTAVESGRLERALELMNDLLVRLDKNELPEYLAEINREATRALDLVVGEVGTEDVLDRVFGEFCIGK
jgi:tRNA modification GTPase